MFAAVLLSAWLGGLGPGLLATVLGFFAANYFLVPPFYRWIPATLPAGVRALVFVGFSILVTLLSESLRRSRARSDERLRELTLETVRRKSAEDVIRRSE